MRLQARMWRHAGTVIAICVTLALVLDDAVLAAALPPDDASISGSLALWLHDAKTNFDTTGGMTLSNNTGADVAILGYSTTSAAGALDQAAWTSVAGHYDGSATGDASVDADDPWTVLSAPERLTDLSEAELVGGDGGQLQNGAAIDLGTPWMKSPMEDVEVQLLLTDGGILDSRNLPSMIRYVGR